MHAKQVPPFDLKLVNLHDPAEFEALREQRVLCGWAYDPEIIAKWRNMMDAKLKSLFWITVEGDQRAGHVSLGRDSGRNPPDLSLANPDGSVLTISNFWISPDHQGNGLGRAVVEKLESMATEPPYGSVHCKAVAVNTISRKYHFDEGEDWFGIWAQTGFPPPTKEKSNEDWYQRMGYVWYKEEYDYPLTTLDGRHVKLLAVFMRKELR